MDCYYVAGASQQRFVGTKKYADTSSVGIGVIDQGVDITFDKKPSRANLVFDEGTVLFAKMAKTKKAFIVDKEHSNWIYSTGFYGLKPKEGFSSKYLFVYLLSEHFNEQKDANAHGITMAALSNSGLEKITIPKYQLSKQNSIADELLLILSAINNLEKEIKLLDELIRSQFNETFTSKSYSSTTLGDCCISISDGTHKTPVYLTQGIPFVSAKNIINGKLSFKDVKFISEEEYSEIQRRCKTCEGDVLLTKSGSLGFSALVETEMKFGLFESLAVLKPNPSLVDGLYLTEVLRMPVVQEQFERGERGIAVKHLHLNVISNIRIPLPPLSEQKLFSDYSKRVNELQNNIQKEKSLLSELLSLKMHQYFD